MINYIIIISDLTFSDIVMDFLALYVIAELDDYIYEAHSLKDIAVKLIEGHRD